jgi:hypothetical protein
MGQAIAITNLDHSAEELRHLAAKHDDAEVVRRLLALALVLDGKSRTEAATQSGMQRQTLRDWVHRYNAEGAPGLTSRTGPGRAPALTDQQMADLKALVVAGPNPEKDGVVRWRCVAWNVLGSLRRSGVDRVLPSLPLAGGAGGDRRDHVAGDLALDRGNRLGHLRLPSLARGDDLALDQRAQLQQLLDPPRTLLGRKLDTLLPRLNRLGDRGRERWPDVACRQASRLSTHLHGLPRVPHDPQQKLDRVVAAELSTMQTAPAGTHAARVAALAAPPTAGRDWPGRAALLARVPRGVPTFPSGLRRVRAQRARQPKTR